MPKKKPPRTRAAERYHHGDLGRALIEAALDLIKAGGGARDLTLRAVARSAGVSHMAPYNHFADKAALVAAAAAEGFRRLRQEMERRMAVHPVGSPLRLQAVGVAYVVFAAANPELFRLMFGPELADTSGHAELSAEAGAVLRTLTGAMGAGGLDGSGGSQSLPAFAVAPWAMVHGVAMLIVARQVSARTPREVEALAMETTRILFDGLKTCIAAR